EAPLRRLSLGDVFVGFGLIDLEICTDVPTDVDVCDVDRQDLKGRARIQPLGEYRGGNQVGVLEYILVALRRADRGDDALAYARDDRRFPRAADQPVDVRAHGNPRLDFQFNSVFGHRRAPGRLDNFRV